MKKVLTFLVLSCSLLTSYAQSDDFGFDFSVGAEKKLRPGTHVSLEGGVRTMDHTKKVDRWTVGVGADQRLFDNGIFDLKVGLKWEYMWINYPEQTKDKTENYEYEHVVLDENDEPYSYYTDDYMGYNHRHQFWRGRHRTSLSLTAGYQPNKRWSFSWKEVVQYSHYNKAKTTMDRYRVDDVEEDENGDLAYTYYLDNDNIKEYKAKDRVLLRSKLGVDYNIRKCPVDPYLSAEYGCGLNYSANKWKFTAGADFKINKQNKIDLFYRYQTEDDDDEPNGHFIGLAYNIKF
ncbi:MAG: DUF2490 domain-containing protein [Bacteroidaceae bacterium]|nr:DUF2490 domain-containing protein [Bacteroidaceae bacterium]